MDHLSPQFNAMSSPCSLLWSTVLSMVNAAAEVFFDSLNLYLHVCLFSDWF